MLRIILIMVIVPGLISLGLSQETFGMFSNFAKASRSTFTSGTLRITASESLESEGAGSHEDHREGESGGLVTVSNVGTLPFKYRVRVQTANTSASGLSPKINLEIYRLNEGGGETKAYSGSLQQAVSGVFLGTLYPAQTQRYRMELKPEGDEDDEDKDEDEDKGEEKEEGHRYANRDFKYELIWDAVQINSLVW